MLAPSLALAGQARSGLRASTPLAPLPESSSSNHQHSPPPPHPVGFAQGACDRAMGSSDPRPLVFTPSCDLSPLSPRGGDKPTELAVTLPDIQLGLGLPSCVSLIPYAPRAGFKGASGHKFAPGKDTCWTVDSRGGRLCERKPSACTRMAPWAVREPRRASKSHPQTPVRTSLVP